MNEGTSCPCCGHRITEREALRWNPETRTLSGRGRAIQLSPVRGKIFDKLWRSWPSGHMISNCDMTSFVYADDPDGGPESTNTIAVNIVFLRRNLAQFGISIRSRHGYLLHEIEQRVAA